jgi:hypothetical protein
VYHEAANVGHVIGLVKASRVANCNHKLQFDGPLWLAVQQNPYRGWGPFVGAPTELGALALSFLLYLRSSHANSMASAYRDLRLRCDVAEKLLDVPCPEQPDGNWDFTS